MKSTPGRIAWNSFLLIGLLIPDLLFAQTKTFIKEYTYQASDFDSKYSSRTLALETVKRNLLEELGTYLISETEVKNMQLSKDQVTTYSAGIVSLEVMDEKWDGKTFWLKARVSANPEDVQRALIQIINDKSKATELDEIRRKAEELTRENERLRSELTSSLKTEKNDTERQAKKAKEYEETIIGLDATEWFNKGFSAALKTKSYREAIEYFTKAVELKPDYAAAYNNRGAAYEKTGNPRQAIEDYTRAIELKGNALPYVNRGIAYGNIGNYQQGIKDCSKAIELKPDYAEGYKCRGFSFLKSGNSQGAIEDYTRAIELKPGLAEAYFGRGLAYYQSGKSRENILDYQRAARLGYKRAQDLLLKLRIPW